jgi:hypothetical protein
MSFWVRVKFDYSGDPFNGHTQEIRTNHYYRDVDHGVLHIKVNSCINILDSLPSEYVCKEVTQEEFEQVLKDTIDYLGVNITNHKFI